MNKPLLAIPALLLLAALPLFAPPEYLLHLLITAFLLGLACTGWAMMGRFGQVSFGHGAFTGIGAYGMAMLWNLSGVSPWIGIPVSVVLAAGAGALLGWPCFRLRVVGHYFALVTLAAGEIVRIFVTAAREITGGSLGMTPRLAPEAAFSAMQFNKAGFWWITLAAWAIGILVWHLQNRSMSAQALAAISEDEDAAASIGIRVAWEKLKVTVVSAALAALAGALMAQYRLYLNPETSAGLGISLQIVFGAIAGGMYGPLGPTLGAIFTIGLEEILRVLFGTGLIGAAPLIYGLLLVLFVLFMPRGLVGLLEGRRRAGGG
jgi:branched-chain amino acid transport system permease protein